LHRPDMLITGRAVLAALIVISAGGMLYSTGVAAVLGLLAALIAILGAYTMTMVLRLRDEIGIVTTCLLTGIAGLVCVGLFSNGTYGGGWNSVGATTYLGMDSLGISGIIPSAASASDPGQLTAQMTAIFAILSFSFGPFAILALAIRRVTVPQYSNDVALSEDSPKLAVVSVSVEEVKPVMVAPPTIQIATNQQEITPIRERLPASAETPQKTGTNKPIKLLERLHMARDANKPAVLPAQARHVAYPVRAGGRRVLLRPLTRPKDGPADPETSEKGA
jgi:hypothetical protein